MQKCVLTFRVPDAILWPAETPSPYTLTLNLLDGKRIAISMRIGIREITYDVRHGMVINGGCVHQGVG